MASEALTERNVERLIEVLESEPDALPDGDQYARGHQQGRAEMGRYAAALLRDLIAPVDFDR